MRLLTAKKLEEIERLNIERGRQAGFAEAREIHHKVYVTAGSYTAAKLAAVTAFQANARYIPDLDGLMGLRGGILLVGYDADPDLVDSAMIRGMTTIHIPT